MKIIITTFILLTPLWIFSADFVVDLTIDNGIDFTSETTGVASDSFSNQKDIVEFKNYVPESLLIRFLDDKRALVAPEAIVRQFAHTPVTPEYDYTRPAAYGPQQNELGYVRIQLPKGVISKIFTIIIYETETNPDGTLIKARDAQGINKPPVAQFTMKADAGRQKFMVSIERSKGKITIRPQKSQKKGLSKKMHSGIPKKQNVRSETISKNLIR